MEASALIGKLAETADSQNANEILRPHKGLKGLSAAFFQEVARLLGTDPAQAFELSKHWKSVRLFGDEAAYAYRAKAAGERAAGQWRRSAESFRKAGMAAIDPADRLSFQRAAIDSLARANRFDEAVALGNRLVRGLDRLDERVTAAQARLNLGNALLWQDRYRLAMRNYSRAIQPLDEAGLQLDAASARIGLSTAHLLGGDLNLAEKYATKARAELQALGLDHYADLAAINLAQKALLTGRADTALDLLLDLRTRVDQASATEQARIHEFIGDAYYRINLWREAMDSYQAALSVAGEIPLLNRANCHFGIGLALLGLDRIAEARARIRTSRRIYERCKNKVGVGIAGAHLGRLFLAGGSPGKAVQICRESEEILGGTHAWFRLAECRLDLAEALLAAGEDASQVLRNASRLVARQALAAHAWRPHALHAVRTSGQVRMRHYRRMLDRMLEARLLTSSTQSRISFLSDKARYIKLYLQELFSNPTKAKIREALQVILRTRSVALLEEILSTSEIPESAGSEINRLREELNALAASEAPLGGARVAGAGTRSASHLQRRWIEATRSIQATAQLSLGEVAPDSVVLIEADDHLYSIVDEQVQRLPVSAAELREKLAWLEFDLLSPAMGGLVSPDVDRTLRSLATSLVEPWYDGKQHVLLSPDGVLWRVPWQALLATLNSSAEPLLALHPSASPASAGATLPAKANVALWVYEGDDLPHARQEAAMFMDIFPNAKVCRSLAEAQESLNQSWDLLHVASHAKLNPENPMFSYLQFSDGRLHAAEIAGSRLHSSIVTLSACETARMSLSVQDEPEGLSRAFLARGAAAVLGSSWALDDETAAVMMKPYYHSLASGSPVVQALREARAAGQAWKSHPYYWAGLVLFAGYRVINER